MDVLDCELDVLALDSDVLDWLLVVSSAAVELDELDCDELDSLDMSDDDELDTLVLDELDSLDDDELDSLLRL